MQRMSINLSDDIKEVLKVQSKKMNISQSALINLILYDWMDERKTGNFKRQVLVTPDESPTGETFGHGGK